MGIWSFVKDAGASLFGGKAEAAEVQEEALKKEIEGLGLDAKDVQLKVEGDTVKVTGTARTAEDQEKLILAVGNVAGVAKVEAETKDDAPAPVFYTVKKGDKVLMPKYGGTEIKLDGKEYQIMREEDILGILEG